jgi:hypothetical protein
MFDKSLLIQVSLDSLPDEFDFEDQSNSSVILFNTLFPSSAIVTYVYIGASTRSQRYLGAKLDSQIYLGVNALFP